MERVSAAIQIKDLKKKFKGGFSLDIPELEIPKGFATALIGEKWCRQDHTAQYPRRNPPGLQGQYQIF